jgi:hypothetical protein
MKKGRNEKQFRVPTVANDDASTNKATLDAFAWFFRRQGEKRAKKKERRQKVFSERDMPMLYMLLP